MKTYLVSQHILNEIWNYVEKNKKFCDLKFQIPFKKLDSQKYKSLLIWHQCQIDLLRTLYSTEVWLNEVEEWIKETNSYPYTFNDPQKIILELKEVTEKISPIKDLFNKGIIPDSGVLNKIYDLIGVFKNTLYFVDYKLDEE